MDALGFRGEEANLEVREGKALVDRPTRLEDRSTRPSPASCVRNDDRYEECQTQGLPAKPHEIAKRLREEGTPPPSASATGVHAIRPR